MTVVTGRVGDASAADTVDWQALGNAGGTLVILMGVSERADIAARLIAGGRLPDTPAAVVHWGTATGQEVVRTTLDGLASVALPAPSVIVVGPVAALELGSTAEGPDHC